MAFSNSSPYFRPGNIRSLTSYVEQSYAENAPPCCYAYVAGGGHDWTCRISGNAFYINYGSSDGSTPRPSTAESARRSSTEPLLLAPPAYSKTPRENDLPFRETPPAYDQIVRADRFYSFDTCLVALVSLTLPPTPSTKPSLLPWASTSAMLQHVAASHRLAPRSSREI